MAAGSALVITLSILVLVSILVLGILATARTERATANSYFQTRQAKSFALMGVDNASALIRQACDAGSQPEYFWSVQPGKITVFHANGTEDTNSSRLLFSTNNTTTNVVNLNQSGFGGLAPIASANSIETNAPPDMSVSWEQVLQDPASPASSTNRIVGRYAFWVDDESSKINVNTADGTIQGTADSFGPGSPTEVSLAALRQATSTLPAVNAAAISMQSGARYSSTNTPRPFNDASEMLQVSGAPTNVVTDNNFNTTAYNRSPELNIFGEPKIYLMSTTTNAMPKDAMTGAYAYSGVPPAPLALTGGDLTSVYPMSSANATLNQLPTFTYRPNGNATDVTVPLPQFFHDDSVGGNTLGNGVKFSPAAANAAMQDYAMGMRIAKYLKGMNSMGTAVTWPQFPGSGTGGFAGKYTDRQIDSIALQILSLIKESYPDHYRKYSLPYVMQNGFLSGKMVRGLSRSPRVNEIVVDITTTAGMPSPKVCMRVAVEWYFPKEFQGTVLDDADTKLWAYGGGAVNCMQTLNYQDAPLTSYDTPSSSTSLAGQGPLGGYWMDNMLTFLDQSGLPAGVDMFGNDPEKPDPDQVKAQAYHPWTLGGPKLPGPDGILGTADDIPNPYAGKYMGTGPLGASGPPPTLPALPSFRKAPMLSMYSPMAYYGATSPVQAWSPGEYRASINTTATSFYPTKPGVTALKLSGGLTIGLHSSAGAADGVWNIDPVPLESMRGRFTGEVTSNHVNAAAVPAVLAAVLPMPNVTIPIPGNVRIHFQVADPLVNSFPGDWVVTVNPPASDITMTIPPGRDPASYTNGRNTIAKDSLATWWPQQSVTIPKNQRFPSAGYLQYVHTGMMPDPSVDLFPIAQQHGTPNRLLNFAPSTDASQTTDGGASYPDWAMLDLFTVPAAMQPLGTPTPTPIQLTWGGATAGRLNANSALLPFSSVARTVPLEGLFKGIQASTAYDASGNPIQTTVDELALAAAVNQYLINLGRPFLLPGEICNVPAVASYLYTGSGSSAESRNDLVRQVVGNLTTRSNTFCVWAVGQVIKKAASNTDYGNFQAGDIVVGESKLKVVIERELNCGADGVPGNTQNPGPDGIVGTPDDPVDPIYHPAMTYPLPYKYRVVSVREIVN